MVQPAAEQHFQRALAAHQQGDLTTAENHYLQAIATDATHPFAATNLSSLYLGANKLEEALMTTVAGLENHPDQAVLYYNYGKLLRMARLPEEALPAFDRAITLDANNAHFYSSRGVTLFDMNRYGDALRDYDRAIAIHPQSAEFYNNRGNAYTHVQQFDKAIADYEKTVTLSPDFPEVHYNWALLELMTGDFARGWKRHEKRWDRAFFARDKRSFSQPLWLGKTSIAGKRILLYPEQGLGDVIQFARYVPILEAMGAKVILEVQKPLVALMQTISPKAIIIPRGDALPEFDLQCPIMSLPLALNTTMETIPAIVPYLSVDASKRQLWHDKLGEQTKPRIGIAWSGSATHTNDHNRSVALSQLAPLWNLPFEFHSLQKEVRESDLAEYLHLVDHRAELHDFTDTAALMDAMDLVISVDTSVAHLAGAIEKPVWVMITAIPDFRWLLNRTDSPWYPTARLFRQPHQGDWDAVVAHVVKALQVL